MFLRYYVDIFPRTEKAADIQTDVSSHVETVLKLSKLPNPQQIDIDLDLDELDVTSAETKATLIRHSDNLRADG